MKVLIFGLGLLGGGYASALYFLERGESVRITDLRSEETLGTPVALLKEKGAQLRCTEHRLEDVLWADIVIKNPAVSVDHPLLKKATVVTTDIAYLLSSELVSFMHIIGITGTKGKTTTAATIAHILNEQGLEAIQCGNMGISGFSVLSDLEMRKEQHLAFPQFLILELSSWQIRDLLIAYNGTLPNFRMVVLTSLFPDHLNSYIDYESYKKDKWLLFSNKNNQIVASEEYVDELIEKTSIPKHKIQVIEKVAGSLHIPPYTRPAWAVCKLLGFSSKAIAKALKSFKGVPHRQEQIAVLDQVVCINDSAATIPEAASFTCSSLPWPYILICGGTDKNLAAKGMHHALTHALQIFVLDGTFSQHKLIPLLHELHLSYEGPYHDMRSVVHDAYHCAQKSAKELGTTSHIAIILSPGAASFGLFLHEFDRGDQFRSAVEEIINLQKQKTAE